MDNFYILYPDQSGLNGVPVYLNARLWENIENKANLMEPLSKYYEWDTFEYKINNFPRKLFFIVKAQKISFDYYPYRSGIVVSNDFVQILLKYTNDFTSVPLEVYSDKLKNITTKEYHFIKFNSYLIDGFDYEKSIYTTNKSDNGENIIINNHHWVANVKKLVLNDKIISDKNIFCLHGWIFLNKPFISRKVLDDCINEKIYGIKYVEVNKLVNFYDDRDYLKKGTKVIE
jgi:hypothetical protein